MTPSSLKSLVVFLALFTADLSAQSDDDRLPEPVHRVNRGLSGLGKWYNIDTGIWESAGWWNGANILTMLGDAALARPSYAPFQLLARRSFSNAIRKAPAKNPDPGRETPKNGNTVSLKVAPPGTKYSKYTDPKTWQPHSNYPDDWFHSEGYPSTKDATGLLLTDAQYDEAVLLANFTPNAHNFLDGYYDDDLWWCLAWVTAYDVTQNPIYLHLAEDIFNAVATTWGTNCGDGGVYWNYNRTYVNAITNELFFSSAAHLANRADNTTHYGDWAQWSLKWFLASGMINVNGTINDGLDNECKNNNGAVWSYNQGVILGGLVEHKRRTGDEYWLDMAIHIASSALEVLSDENGIIHDPCEIEKSCGADGTQFKGIFMRNLQKLWSETRDQYLHDAINKNAHSIWHKARSGDVFGNNWAKAFEGPANASMQGSALDGLVANVLLN